MSFISRHSRILVVAVSCAVIGAGASAIATAGASTSPPQTSTAQAVRVQALRRWERRTVQGSVVIATRQGFKTVTATIPANARVRDNGQKSTLSAVKDGQRVIVLTRPKNTFVIARAPHN